MTTGRIATYEERGQIATAGHESIRAVETIHARWRNFVSQAAIRAIAPAPDSMLLLLATWGGLLVWDRQVYRRYTSEHGLAGNGVHALCVDGAGRFWLASEGGLTALAGESWKVSTLPSGERVRALAAAGGTGIWAATAATIYHLSDPDLAATPVASAPHLGAVDAHCLLHTEEGLLLGNPWGLYRLRLGVEPQRLHADVLESCVGLARDGRDQIWIAAPGRLYHLSGDDLQEVAAPPPASAGEILAIAAAKRRVWVLQTGGLAYIEDDRWNPIQSGTDDVQIRTLASSGDDFYLWCGTDTERLVGIYAAPQQPPRLDRHFLPSHTDDSLINLTTCLAGPAAEGQICVGSAGALYAFSVDGSWETLAENSHVRSLCVDGKGLLWLLSWPEGVRCSDPDRPAPTLPGLPQRLIAGRDGQVYALTGRGLWRLDEDRWVPLLPAPPAAVHALAQTADSLWWLATEAGIYTQEGGHWGYRGETPGPRNSSASTLCPMDGSLWAGGEAGIWRWTGNAWEDHTMIGSDQQPIPVWRIAAAEGKLWLARADGLIHYDPDQRAVIDHFTPANSGLASPHIVDLLATPTHLWVATRAGVSCLTLEEVKSEK